MGGCDPLGRGHLRGCPRNCRIPQGQCTATEHRHGQRRGRYRCSDAAFLTPEEIQGIRGREQRVYRRAGLIFTMSHRLRTILHPGISTSLRRRLATVHCGGAQVATGRTHVPPPPPPPIGGPRCRRILPRFSSWGATSTGRGETSSLGGLPSGTRRAFGTRCPLTIVGPGSAEAGATSRSGWRCWGTWTGTPPRKPPGWTPPIGTPPSSASLHARFEPLRHLLRGSMSKRAPCLVGPDGWAVRRITNRTHGLLVPAGDPEALALGA